MLKSLAFELLNSDERKLKLEQRNPGAYGG
jgi:hypothetical protein